MVCMREKAGGWSHIGKCRSISRVRREYTDDARSHHLLGAKLWVGSSRNWSVFLERPNTERHEKAPVRCRRSWLAAFNGALLTHLL